MPHKPLRAVWHPQAPSAQEEPAQGNLAGDRCYLEKLSWLRPHRPHCAPGPWYNEASQREMHASQVGHTGEVGPLHTQPMRQGKSPGQNQGFLLRFLLFGFPVSMCPLNLIVCCNILCPKGLSIWATLAKTGGGRGWWHMFKPGQAMATQA